jgi:hypothetical protein
VEGTHPNSGGYGVESGFSPNVFSMPSGTLGDLGYCVCQSRSATVPLNALGQSTLPIDFPYFGQIIPRGTSLGVDSNGALTFGGGTNAPAPNSTFSFPTQIAPPSTIGFGWGSLSYIAGTGEGLGAGTVSAANSFTAELVSFPEYDGNPLAIYLPPQTAWVTLFSSGLIQVRSFIGERPRNPSYPVRAAPPPGVVGIQDATRTLGLSPDCAAGSLTTFYPSFIAPPGDFAILSATLLPTRLVHNTLQTPPPPPPVDVQIKNFGASDSVTVTLYLVLMGDLLLDGSQYAMQSLASGWANNVAAGATVSVTLQPQVLVYPRNTVYEAVLMASNKFDNNRVYDLGPVLVSDSIAQIQITTSSVADATAGRAYSFPFHETGSPSPSWQLLSTPPPGLTLSSSGALAGIPQAPGSYLLSVGVSDQGPYSTYYLSDQRQFFLTVH